MEIFGLEIDIYVAIVILAALLVVSIIWLCFSIAGKMHNASKNTRKKTQSGEVQRRPAITVQTATNAPMAQLPMNTTKSQNQARANSQETQNKELSIDTPEFDEPAYPNDALKNQQLINPQGSNGQNQQTPDKGLQKVKMVESTEILEINPVKNIAEISREQKGKGDSMSLLWEDNKGSDDAEEQSEDNEGIFDLFGHNEIEDANLTSIAANLPDVDIGDLLNLNQELSTYTKQNKSAPRRI
jgi:hypothetical protein